MTLEYSRRIFEKSSNIKFHENPSSGSRVVLCGWTDGRPDMTTLIVAFRNSANAPKNRYTVMWRNSKDHTEVSLSHFCNSSHGIQSSRRRRGRMRRRMCRGHSVFVLPSNFKKWHPCCVCKTDKQERNSL